MAAPKYPWNGILARPLMPLAGQTVNGEGFAVPRGASHLTIHIPALVGVATTILIQSLNPDIGADGTETWVTVSVFDLTDGTFELLDGLAESTTVTLPVSATGGGNLRLVASADQSSVPVRIPILFGFE